MTSPSLNVITLLCHTHDIKATRRAMVWASIILDGQEDDAHLADLAAADLEAWTDHQTAHQLARLAMVMSDLAIDPGDPNLRIGGMRQQDEPS